MMEEVIRKYVEERIASVELERALYNKFLGAGFTDTFTIASTSVTFTFSHSDGRCIISNPYHASYEKIFKEVVEYFQERLFKRQEINKTLKGVLGCF